MNHKWLPPIITSIIVCALGLLPIVYPSPPFPDNRLQIRLVHQNYAEVENSLSTGEAPEGYELLYRYDWTKKIINKNNGYIVDKKILMDARFIIDCFEKKDSTSNNYYLVIKLDHEGSRIIEKITKINIDQRMTIIVERKLFATIVISEKMESGNIKLHGIGSQKIIREIAALLRAMPIHPGYIL